MERHSIPCICLVDLEESLVDFFTCENSKSFQLSSVLITKLNILQITVEIIQNLPLHFWHIIDTEKCIFFIKIF